LQQEQLLQVVDNRYDTDWQMLLRAKLPCHFFEPNLRKIWSTRKQASEIGQKE
jgi:hypothetical protein